MKLQLIKPVIKETYYSSDDASDIAEFLPAPIVFSVRYHPGTLPSGWDDSYTFIIKWRAPSNNEWADLMLERCFNRFFKELPNIVLVNNDSQEHGAWLFGFEYLQFKNASDNVPEMVTTLRSTLDECLDMATEVLKQARAKADAAAQQDAAHQRSMYSRQY